jgi:hypothetical protein
MHNVVCLDFLCGKFVKGALQNADNKSRSTNIDKGLVSYLIGHVNSWLIRRNGRANRALNKVAALKKIRTRREPFRSKRVSWLSSAIHESN